MENEKNKTVFSQDPLVPFKSVMSEPMDTDSDSSADMQPIDLSVRKRKSSSPPPPPPPPPQRPTVVVLQQQSVPQSTAQTEPLDARKPLLAVSPQMADRPAAASTAAADSSSHRPVRPQPLPFFFTDDGGPSFGSAAPQPPSSPPPAPRSSPPPPLPPLGQRSSRAERQFLQQRRLGDLDMALHQQQLELQHQQQQLRFQYQLHQHQLRLAAYGDVGGHGALHLDTIMLARQMAAAVQAPSSASSTDSDPFPFAGTAASFGCLHHHHHRSAVDDFGYGNNSNNNNTRPYFNGLSSGVDESSESTALEDAQHRGGGSIFGAAALIIGGVGLVGLHGEPAADAEDVADIYRTSEFLAFRQRYMDSLGPPRNYEKMRRSAPANKQPPAFDVSYAQKRIKNNEAAKKSRDAKRQKFLENQISVMYLTKKIREMNDLKRRLLMSMT